MSELTVDAGPLPAAWPPLEPEQIAKVTAEAARRTIEGGQKAFEIMLKYVAGFRDLPPRQRSAIFAQVEQDIAAGLRLDLDGRPLLSMQDWFVALMHVNAKETAWMISDYLRFDRERNEEA